MPDDNDLPLEEAPQAPEAPSEESIAAGDDQEPLPETLIRLALIDLQSRRVSRSTRASWISISDAGCTSSLAAWDASLDASLAASVDCGVSWSGRSLSSGMVGFSSTHFSGLRGSWPKHNVLVVFKCWFGLGLRGFQGADPLFQLLPQLSRVEEDRQEVDAFDFAEIKQSWQPGGKQSPALPFGVREAA